MELHRVSFLANYGDYAGCLFDRLRAIALEKGMQLPRTVTACQTALHKEEKEGGGRNIKMLESCVQRLRDEGYDVGQSLAHDAIELYTRTSEVCHAAAGSKAIRIGSNQWHNLIDQDIANLPAAATAEGISFVSSTSIESFI